MSRRHIQWKKPLSPDPVEKFAHFDPAAGVRPSPGAAKLGSLGRLASRKSLRPGTGTPDATCFRVAISLLSVRSEAWAPALGWDRACSDLWLNPIFRACLRSGLAAANTANRTGFISL